MKKIYWFGLILFGLCLTSVSIISNNVSAIDNLNIYFQDSPSKGGTVIYVDNTSFYNNLTSEIYKDDLQTQRILESRNQTRIQWLTSMGTYIEYAYPMSPMDTNAFNRTQFYFYAQYTGTPKYINLSFEITTLNNGTTFTRTVRVNSSGKKYILNEGEFCKSSYRYQVVSLQSGFTRFKIILYQPRWGVISKYGNDYYIKNAGIQCYTSVPTGYKITLINQSIYFNLDSNFNNYVFDIHGQNDITFTDFNMYVDDKVSLYNKNKWLFLDGRNINITRCSIFSNHSNEFNGAYFCTLNIYDSFFNNVGIKLMSFQNIQNTLFTNTGHEELKHYFKFYQGGILKNCIFSNSKYGFYIYSTLHNYNVTDCLFKNIDYILFPDFSGQVIYFINCTSDKWIVDDSLEYPYNTGSTYRSYTFGLKTMNGTNVLSGVNVKIYDKTNTLKYSGTTNSNGCIPKQIFNYCIWNVTYPYTPYIFSDYILNLTKTGFQSMNYKFNNSKELNFTITMLENTTCPETDITLYENFDNATGTHEYLLNSSGYFVWANVTGNETICPPQNLTNYTVGLNFTGLNGYISWTGDYTINQTNISFNVPSNMSLNGSVNVNEDDYFLSGILTFENSQFFLMLLIGLWLFFVSEYVKYKETMLAWIQLIFAFPVTLFLSSIAYFNSIPLILPVIFIIPILGIYLVADAIYYSKKPKKNK